MAQKALETLTASIRQRSLHPTVAVLTQNLQESAPPPPDPSVGLEHYFRVLNTALNIREARRLQEAMVRQGQNLQEAYQNWYEDLARRYQELRGQVGSFLSGIPSGTPSRRLSAPSHIASILQRASQLTGVPVHILTAVARAESGFRTNAVSPAGAIGLMQLMPGTARALGVNPWDPVQNAIGGARYLAQQLKRFGDLRLALAAYNAGPGRVQNAIRKAGSRDWSAIARYLPRETRNYVARIMGWLQ